MVGQLDDTPLFSRADDSLVTRILIKRVSQHNRALYLSSAIVLVRTWVSIYTFSTAGPTNSSYYSSRCWGMMQVLVPFHPINITHGISYSPGCIWDRQTRNVRKCTKAGSHFGVRAKVKKELPTGDELTPRKLRAKLN
jgi:hypothetical protein